MKSTARLSVVMSLALFLACQETPEPAPPEPIGGRDPQALLWLSGIEWRPALIALQINREGEAKSIYMNVSSSKNNGFLRDFFFALYDDNLEVPASGTLDYWDNEYPVTINSWLRQYTDNNNKDYSQWVAGRPDLGGISIESIEFEDGVYYASGEFRLTVLADDQTPNYYEMNGLFNNVRVFYEGVGLKEYFDRLTELEKYQSD